MKIQSKITLLFLLLSGVILVLLNITIFYLVYRFGFDDFFKRLEARVNISAEVRLFPGAKSQAYQEVRNRYLEKLESEKEYFFSTDTLNKININGGINVKSSFIKNILKDSAARYKVDNIFYAGKVFTKGNSRYIVIVSAIDPSGFQELKDLQRILVYGFLAAMILVYFVGKIFSFYTFQPVRRIINNVKNITANNLHFRLDELSGKDEIAELSYTFNDMLNRLETAFETQNNFVSNASHELRTPLTIISTEAELALSKTDANPEQRQIFGTIYSESEKLGQILNSLLTLAQSGFDGKKQRWESIRMDELLMTASESIKRINTDSNIQIDLEDMPTDEHLLYVSGNSNLLRLAVTNIISNACKYSDNRMVKIRLLAENNKVIISITDQGIGIPESELQHIFEPFFRASNTHSYEGHGVGLPLTLNIIRLHRGSIGIRSDVGKGTEIKVFLPLEASA
ncbi:HAMP domain-containing sensor histidine kinase [Mucilaginibacter lappiensis]|uniref:histidine kinase n=1 Tax=Mucilaginibacter lappiensis TaxID=354630 RepID=A0A1N6Y9U5_9SPHI|nr:HAMP domain-containing sensor histidine kinase [Mucilaginibacter lappiensis]MBB6109675.1 signal transduction histidine kinase [Mucilaginibacter lappiensis]MBB6128978.1 signal transduction histidine kinase [Mucilaginibacter lappiensis]SIR11402.1 Signal transduction histidine kinase [Mucilaginibacter lappiensis]